MIWRNDKKLSELDELVELGGGDINAELRFSMKWDSWSDLDLHLIEPPIPYDELEHEYPPTPHEIYFNSKESAYKIQNELGEEKPIGELDVDMNVGSELKDPMTAKHHRPAVENISFAKYDTVPDGEYSMHFRQFGVWGDRGPNDDFPEFTVTRFDGGDRRARLVFKYVGEQLPELKTSEKIVFKKQGDEFILTTLPQTFQIVSVDTDGKFVLPNNLPVDP